MYLYYWPPEFGLIMAIVAVVALLVFILKRAHVPQVLLLIVFAIIALPIYLLLSIIEKCKKENGKK